MVVMPFLPFVLGGVDVIVLVGVVAVVRGGVRGCSVLGFGAIFLDIVYNVFA